VPQKGAAVVQSWESHRQRLLPGAITQRESWRNELQKGPLSVIAFQLCGAAFPENSDFRRIPKWDRKNKRRNSIKKGLLLCALGRFWEAWCSDGCEGKRKVRLANGKVMHSRGLSRGKEWGKGDVAESIKQSVNNYAL